MKLCDAKQGQSSEQYISFGKDYQDSVSCGSLEKQATNPMGLATVEFRSPAHNHKI
jgi:hypothetical protein